MEYRRKTQSYREDKLRINSASGQIIPEVLPFIDSLFKALEMVEQKSLVNMMKYKYCIKSIQSVRNLDSLVKKLHYRQRIKNIHVTTHLSMKQMEK